MSSRVVDGPFEAVQAVPVVKLLCRLCSRVVAQVLLDVFLAAEHRRVLAPPGPQLHLVVAVKGSGIEKDTLVCLSRDAHVAFPEIPVDDARLDWSAAIGEIAEETRDNLGGNLVNCAFIVWPRAVPVDISLTYAEEHGAIEDGPVVFPIYEVRSVTVACGDMKAKLAVGGPACLVKGCESAGELLGVGGCSDIHVDICRKVEVRGWPLTPESPESNRRRDEVWYGVVDGLG